MLKTNLGCSCMELVRGISLWLPSDFFEPFPPATPRQDGYVESLKWVFEDLFLVLTRVPARKTSYITQDL